MDTLARDLEAILALYSEAQQNISEITGAIKGSLSIGASSTIGNYLLPHIIVSRDNRVREDFLTNSGLDRFYVEELERDYFDLNQIDMDILEELRK